MIQRLEILSSSLFFYPKISENNMYHMLIVEIKEFNASTDNKPFFDQPIKRQEAYEKLVEMSSNDDYTEEFY